MEIQKLLFQVVFHNWVDSVLTEVLVVCSVITDIVFLAVLILISFDVVDDTVLSETEVLFDAGELLYLHLVGINVQRNFKLTKCRTDLLIQEFVDP